MDKSDLLRKYFMSDSFKEYQSKLIDNISEGNDSLGVISDSAERYMCTYISALLLNGMTIIISSEIDFLKKQSEPLINDGVKIAYIDSNDSLIEYINDTDTHLNEYKIICINPETAITVPFLINVFDADISLIAVDNADAVSQKGDCFNPIYTHLPEFIDKISSRPVICAFCDPIESSYDVRNDIVSLLLKRNPSAFVQTNDTVKEAECPKTLNRENLYYAVLTPGNKPETLVRYLRVHVEEYGIIFCAIRKTVDELYDKLINSGISACRYHTGLSDEDRNKNIQDFLSGHKHIMLATSAIMSADGFCPECTKDDIGYIIHFNMPKSLEVYYNESGLAGIGGNRAECIIYYSAPDININRRLIEKTYEINKSLSDADKDIEFKKLRDMSSYCTSNTCLRAYMLRYFGEDYTAEKFDDCSACLVNYEFVNVTDIAKSILNCVRECGQKYGINLIIETLRGGRSERIRTLKLDEMKNYGIHSTITAQRIRAVLNHLVLIGCLSISEEDPVLRLTKKAAPVMFGGEQIMLRVAMQHKPETESAHIEPRPIPKVLENASSAETSLFNSLRTIRTDIARVEKIPPYTIFADKTLIDMCRRLPVTRDEMLEVIGVGEMKYKKYGEKFISAIKSYIAERGINSKT